MTRGTIINSSLIQTFKALEAAAKKVGLQVNTVETKYVKVSNSNHLGPPEDRVKRIDLKG